jgi:hypothetical protein
MNKKSKISDLEILASLPVRVDFILLQDRFSHYKNQKKKIFDLKQKGLLQQIQRGQYFNTKSKNIESTPYETLANSIYFPSYVSVEWALQHYGLITDRVTTVTSVTTLRSKTFITPYAPFSYIHIPKKRYPIGYVTKVENNHQSFLIARPEKALIDYINVKGQNLVIKNETHIEEFLAEDLRLDIEEFLNIVKVSDLKELLPFYHRNSKEHRILKWLIHRKDLSK